MPRRPSRSLQVFPYNNNFDPPAPFMEASLVSPDPSSFGPSSKLPALLDTGADITVIPKWIVEPLQLKCVSSVKACGFDGEEKDVDIYLVKIIFDNIGEYEIWAMVSENDHMLIGRDILNRWSIFLKGPVGRFEIG